MDGRVIFNPQREVVRVAVEVMDGLWQNIKCLPWPGNPEFFSVSFSEPEQFAITMMGLRG
jgi:hypothetical protein